MPDTNEEIAANSSDSSRQRCSTSCLPFCFWGAGSRSGGAQAKRRRRRRLRLRLSWLAWPWFRKSGGNKGGDDGSREGKKKKKRKGRRLLLLLTAALRPKQALASVVSGDGALLPVPAKVSSFGDAKRQSNRRLPRPAVDDAASGGSRQPQASTTAAATASTGRTTAPSRPPPESTSRRHSLRRRQPDDGCSSSGLWTAATTLGVTVLFGRVTAVVFLCSCLYGARFVRAWAAGAKPQISSGVSSSSRRFGGPVGVAADKVVVVAEPCTTEECKKKVVMAGLLDRAGKTPSSRFGR